MGSVANNLVTDCTACGSKYTAVSLEGYMQNIPKLVEERKELFIEVDLLDPVLSARMGVKPGDFIPLCAPCESSWIEFVAAKKAERMAKEVEKKSELQRNFNNWINTSLLPAKKGSGRRFLAFNPRSLSGFLWELLTSGDKYQEIICWTGSGLDFELKNPQYVARLWGERWGSPMYNEKCLENGLARCKRIEAVWHVKKLYRFMDPEEVASWMNDKYPYLSQGYGPKPRLEIL